MLNVDGFGAQALKIAKYKNFVAQAPGFRRGFKLFYQEDTEHDDPAPGHAAAAAAGRRGLRMSAVTASENTTSASQPSSTCQATWPVPSAVVVEVAVEHRTRRCSGRSTRRAPHAPAACRAANA